MFVSCTSLQLILMPKPRLSALRSFPCCHVTRDPPLSIHFILTSPLLSVARLPYFLSLRKPEHYDNKAMALIIHFILALISAAAVIAVAEKEPLCGIEVIMSGAVAAVSLPDGSLLPVASVQGSREHHKLMAEEYAAASNVAAMLRATLKEYGKEYDILRFNFPEAGRSADVSR